MKHQIILLYIVLLATLQSNVYAQMAIGQWRTHFAYNLVEQIAQTENKIFAVSEGALFSVDKNDELLEFYSKVNGLNDANIVKISYDNKLKKLIIAYANGNIDIMSSGGVANIPDMNIKMLNSDKRVYHIFHYNDFAYLSTDFGIVKLNVKRNEITDTYIIGQNSTDVKVLATVVFNNTIYAISENRIYKADVNDRQLVDFSKWTVSTDLPIEGKLKNIGILGSHLILQQGNQLFRFLPNGNWERVLSNISNAARTYFKDERLFVSDNGATVFDVNQQFEVETLVLQNQAFDAHYDQGTNTYWFAGNDKGIVSYHKQSALTKTYVPNGPAVNSPFKMHISDDRVIVVPGSAWAVNKMLPMRVMIYEKVDGAYGWRNIHVQSQSPLIDRYVYDAVDVIMHPNDKKHFFVASFANGLFEFRDDTFYKWHNHTNSSLETIISNEPFNYIWVDGFKFDKEGNLFMTNGFVGKYLQMLKPDGSWKAFEYPRQTFSNLGTIIIPQSNPNHKWIPSKRNSTGIIVIDNKGTLEDQSDD